LNRIRPQQMSNSFLMVLIQNCIKIEYLIKVEET